MALATKQTQVPGIVSDLFFNYRNERYDALVFPDATPEMVEEAIKGDAAEFCEYYKQLIGIIDPDELAADFLKRL